MALIKQGTSINCRNQEELEIFSEVASAEGHLWLSGRSLKERGYSAPISFQVGYAGNQFPNDITYCNNMNFTGHEGYDHTMTVVEASDLFRNHLISRRVKHERNSTK